MPLTPPNALDILAFHREAGVDTALEEAPVNRFAESAAKSEEPARPSGREAAAQDRVSSFVPAREAAQKSFAAPVAPDEAIMAARAAAKSAKTLDELRETLSRFEGCALKNTAKNLVFADGNPAARVMFVGEAPGADEDREGLPFVGRSGKLLDRMMAAIGLDRTSAYIANIVPWRPPGNRTPTPQESAICLPFIRRQIELANPDFLVCLGKPSMQTLLEINDGIKTARGRWHDYDTGSRVIKAMATFHPAYLLRTPAEKKFAWRDMLTLKKALNG
ncbi:MAG TPA: uracil-DNA glycosylase [Xanthobacteraceae bacterium]|nr:uracil-DNA glycosylase [Xanthobacteraceae bacterium]